MLTNEFINLSLAILLSDNQKLKDSAFNNLHDILIFYKDREKNIPLQFRSKLQLVISASISRKNKKGSAETLDSIILSGQFKDLESYIEVLKNVKIEEDKIDEAINRIKSRKRMISVLQDIPNLERVIDQFNNSSYSDIDEFLDGYERIISSMYGRISEEKRKTSNARILTLDMVSDDYNCVLDQIELSYSGVNSISTGYSGLNNLLNGGFEPSRLYIFGGSSGDGKSALLLNFLRNAVDRKKEEEERLSGLMDIYVYITLENLIDESLVRLYCSHQDMYIDHMISNFSNLKSTISPTLKEWQTNNNSVLSMAYFPPTVTSVSDLMVHLDTVKSRYEGKGRIKAIYVDYLDLLMAGQKFDLHRLEMGQVTIDLKVMAVKESIPVITVTQLNRSIRIKSIINIKGIGYTTLDQVKVGDYVKRGNSWVKVLKVFPKEKKKCYKIITKSGKEIICGPKHNFPTSSGDLKNIKYSGLVVGDKLYTERGSQNV